MKNFFLTLTTLLSIPAFAEIYSPQQAFEDIAVEPLQFVGRDYPNADLGPGGNYVCIYKNSRVYVRHEGCRPSWQQSLSVFSAKIISRHGGLVDIYLEHNRENYNINQAGPDFNGTWKLTSINTQAFSGELSFKELIALERNSWQTNYHSCTVGKSSMYPESNGITKCYGSAADENDELAPVWKDPLGHGLLQVHDLILKAPRK
jgi:hypothetical protein